MLTDIEGVSSALPGFKLTGPDGDGYAGTMKVKVGAVDGELRRDDGIRRERRCRAPGRHRG
jgi:carbon monoxide dehydrogenase subunit G